MRKLHFSLAAICLMATASHLRANAQDLMPATFEDLGLAPESHWVGDTDDEDYMMGSFRSGSFEFNNFYWADYDSWAFFGYANYTGNQYTGSMSQQWNNTVGGGYQSPTYGVLYYSSWMGNAEATLPDFPLGATVSGMWVVNSAWVADAIANGDGMSGPFEKGDKMTLTAIGFDADDEECGSTDFLLADYTADDPALWYAVNDWRWMDLSTLGPVTRIRFVISSTKSNEFGMTTPGYACFDDLGISSPTGIDTPDTGDSYRVSVRDGYAVISGQESTFTVTPVSLSGICGQSVQAVDGIARVPLTPGMTLLRIGSQVIRVIL